VWLTHGVHMPMPIRNAQAAKVAISGGPHSLASHFAPTTMGSTHLVGPAGEASRDLGPLAARAALRAILVDRGDEARVLVGSPAAARAVALGRKRLLDGHRHRRGLVQEVAEGVEEGKRGRHGRMAAVGGVWRGRSGLGD
jgi:hypothetical protein